MRQETKGLSTKNERKEVGSLRRIVKAHNGCVGEQESPRTTGNMHGTGWNIHRAGGPQTALCGSENQTTETKLVRTKKGR